MQFSLVALALIAGNVLANYQQIQLNVELFDIPRLDTPSLFDPFGRSDPFYQAFLITGGPKVIAYKSEVQKNKRVAKFRPSAPISVPAGANVQIDVYDKDTVTFDDPLGFIQLTNFELTTQVTVSRPLQCVRVSPCGNIVVHLQRIGGVQYTVPPMPPAIPAAMPYGYPAPNAPYDYAPNPFPQAPQPYPSYQPPMPQYAAYPPPPYGYPHQQPPYMPQQPQGNTGGGLMGAIHNAVLGHHAPMGGMYGAPRGGADHRKDGNSNDGSSVV